MNEMIQKICTRHAIRRFEDRQLEESTLEEILTAGLYAPSAGNNQQSRIVVCQNPEVNAELGKISRYMRFKGGDPKKMSHAISAEQPSIQDDHTILNGFYDAPTVLTIFARPGQYAHDDAAMIAENILLAAHFLGVGGCYIGRSEEVFATPYGRSVREKWGVPETLTAVCNVVLGYRAGPAPKEKPRREGRIIRA